MPSVSQVGDRYLVIEDDGTNHGPYDERMQAAAKYRELMRENGNGNGSGHEQSGGRLQQAATRFSSGVNRAVQKAGDAGRGLAEKADAAAAEAAEGQFEETEREKRQDTGPSLDFLGGGTGGGGQDGEMQLPFGGGETGPDDVQLPFAEGGGGDDPDLSFLGGGGAEPKMPQFGPDGDGAGDGPQMPDFMGQGPDTTSLPFGDPPEEKGDGQDNQQNDPLRFF